MSGSEKIRPIKQRQKKKDSLPSETAMAFMESDAENFSSLLNFISGNEAKNPHDVDDLASWLAQRVYINPNERQVERKECLNRQLIADTANSIIGFNDGFEKEFAGARVEKVLFFIHKFADIAYHIDLVSHPDEQLRIQASSREELQKKARHTNYRERYLRTIESGLSKALAVGLCEDIQQQVAHFLKKFQEEFDIKFPAYIPPSPSQNKKVSRAEQESYPISEESRKEILAAPGNVQIQNLVFEDFWRENGVPVDTLDRLEPSQIWTIISPHLTPRGDSLQYFEAEEILATSWIKYSTEWKKFITAELKSRSGKVEDASEFIDQLFSVWNAAQKSETEWRQSWDYLHITDDLDVVFYRRSIDLLALLEESQKHESNVWLELQKANLIESLEHHLRLNQSRHVNPESAFEDRGYAWFRVDPLHYGMWSDTGTLLLSDASPEAMQQIEEAISRYKTDTITYDEFGGVASISNQTKDGQSDDDIARIFCTHALTPDFFSRSTNPQKAASITNKDIRGYEIMLKNLSSDIEREFPGIHLEQLPIREQFYFLDFIKRHDALEVAETQRYVRAYGMPGLRTFLVSEQDPEFAGEIVWTGNLLLEGVMTEGDPLFQEILQAYSRVLDGVDIARSVYRERFGKDLSEEEFERVGEALRARATAILKKATRSILGDTEIRSNGSEIVRVDSIQKELQKAEAEVIILTSILRSFNLDPTALKGSELQEISGSRLRGQLQRQVEMLAIQEKQYRGRPGYNDELVNELNKALREAMSNTRSRFFVYMLPFTTKDTAPRVGGFFRLDLQGTDEDQYLHLASVMLDPALEGGKIVENILQKSIAQEAKQLPIRAEYDPSPQLLALYSRLGFIGKRFGYEMGTPTIYAENSENLKNQFPAGTPFLDEKSVKRRVGSVSASKTTQYLSGAATNAHPEFESIMNEGFALTRYFTSNGKYYAAFEKVSE